MDNSDVVAYLGRQEGKSLLPLERSELNSRLPALYVSVRQDAPSSRERVVVQAENYAGHDNEGRMPFVCDFLRRAVLPHLSCDITGWFNIQLHDSYTYLNDGIDYTNVLTFSKHKEDAGPVLLPDPFQMQGYSGMLSSLVDKLSWEEKVDKMVFAGTTTGDRRPLHNERVRACLWSAKNRSISDFYITNVAQMHLADLRRDLAGANADADAILRPPMSAEDQFRYKFNVNIRGNTCCWSRVPMIMASNSLMLNLYHSDVTWYYPLLHQDTHYVGCGMHDLHSKFTYCLNNPDWCKFIVKSANRFVSQFCGSIHASIYLKSLFETAAGNMP